MTKTLENKSKEELLQIACELNNGIWDEKKLGKYNSQVSMQELFNLIIKQVGYFDFLHYSNFVYEKPQIRAFNTEEEFYKWIIKTLWNERYKG